MGLGPPAAPGAISAPRCSAAARRGVGGGQRSLSDSACATPRPSATSHRLTEHCHGKAERKDRAVKPFHAQLSARRGAGAAAHAPATPAHAPTAPAHMAPRPPRCHSRSRKGDAARVCADGRTGDQNAVHTCNGGRSSHRRHGPPTRAATGTDPDSVRPSETSQTRTARFHSHEVTDQNRQRQGRGAGAWWGPCCSGGTKVSDAAMMTPQHQERSEGRLEVADSMLHIF